MTKSSSEVTGLEIGSYESFNSWRNAFQNSCEPANHYRTCTILFASRLHESIDNYSNYKYHRQIWNIFSNPESSNCRVIQRVNCVCKLNYSGNNSTNQKEVRSRGGRSWKNLESSIVYVRAKGFPIKREHEVPGLEPKELWRVKRHPNERTCRGKLLFASRVSVRSCR